MKESFTFAIQTVNQWLEISRFAVKGRATY